MVMEKNDEQWCGTHYDNIDYSCRLEFSAYNGIRNAKTKRIYALHAGANE